MVYILIKKIEKTKRSIVLAHAKSDWQIIIGSVLIIKLLKGHGEMDRKRIKTMSWRLILRPRTAEIHIWNSTMIENLEQKGAFAGRNLMSNTISNPKGSSPGRPGFISPRFPPPARAPFNIFDKYEGDNH
jgi:hypothetical protein